MFDKGIYIGRTCLKLPKVCPTCGGEVILRGFEGSNRRLECRKHEKHMYTRC